MRYSFTTAALFAATASADLCSLGHTLVDGNYYCQQANAITYKNVGYNGTYNKITAMDSTSGTCQSTPQPYSGTLSPFDEPLSLHLRGPILLKQLAVYLPSSCPSSPPSYGKAKGKRSAHERRHVYGHAHIHSHTNDYHHKKRTGELVSTIIDNKLVSWINKFTGLDTSGSSEPSKQSGEDVKLAFSKSFSAVAHSKTPSSSNTKAHVDTSSSSDSCDGSDTSAASWKRVAYYNSENQTAEGLTFLNYYGGQDSGTFDYSFGNSLSYASADGRSGASSPQILEDCTIPSEEEIIIMSDSECSSAGECGYYRNGTVAYNGWGGAEKAFFFKFSMPISGETKSATIYEPVDMSALWMLNAQIPRTLQYGKHECSCWATGCGELDVFEVLAPGDTRCKSTIHGNLAGGCSDWFPRPTSRVMTAVALFYQDKIHIKILDDSTTFRKTLDRNFISEIITSTTSESTTERISLFDLGG